MARSVALPLPSIAVPLTRARRDRLVFAAILLAAALFLFIDREPMPIILWDESRLIVNALEMKRTGWSLVTTYDGRPDLWNTKPPLLIWLMTGSVALFGPSEAALRLPSAVAALGTLALVMRFTHRATGSIAAAAGAAALLTLSPGFFGEHGARTADYDALLVLFTTAYLTLLFEAVHRPRPPRRLLLASAVAVTGAVLTKDIAGLTPGAGVLLYLALIRRPLRWHWRDLALAAVVAVAPMAVFAGLREAAAPGYLAAALHNDVIARAGQSLVGDPKPLGFYFIQLADGYAAAIVLVAVAGVALARGWVGGRARLALIYALANVVALLAIVTVAQSKLSHYLLPALPFLAIAIAIGLHAAARHVATAGRLWPPLVLALIIAWPLTNAAARAVNYRYIIDPAREFAGNGQYGRLFARLPRDGRAVTIVDPGFTLQGVPHYVAVLRAYRLLWAAQGLPTYHVTDLAKATGVTATCDPATARRLSARAPDTAGLPDCALVDLSPRTAAPASPAAS